MVTCCLSIVSINQTFPLQSRAARVIARSDSLSVDIFPAPILDNLDCALRCAAEGFHAVKSLLFYPETRSFATRESVGKPINSRLRATSRWQLGPRRERFLASSSREKRADDRR